MKKKAGIVLTITGVVFIITAIIMMLTIPVHQDKDIFKDEKEATEVAQEVKNQTESFDKTEQHGEWKQGTGQEPKITEKKDLAQQSTEQSVHDINSEVYKWPCNNKEFQNRDEPKKVVEFAKYKEYYEQIALQFLEYEGKDVYFYATDDMLYFDECKNEGSIKVSYNKEVLLDLFEKSRLGSIWVGSDYIIFNTDVSDGEKIMYFYDETLTYSDPYPSEKDDLINGYFMVNIAPHWWWRDSSPGK